LGLILVAGSTNQTRASSPAYEAYRRSPLYQYAIAASVMAMWKSENMSLAIAELVICGFLRPSHDTCTRSSDHCRIPAK
jgi:hypothetical protein